MKQLTHPTTSVALLAAAERQLSAYALAAGVLVGVTTGAQVAHADIIYFPHNPGTTLTNVGSFNLFTGGPTLRLTQASGGFYRYAGLTGGGALVKTGNYAANLALSSTIGLGAAFRSNGSAIGYTSGNFHAGNFFNQTGYVGLRFTDPNVAGQTDYGWARIGLNASGSQFTINDYAYNNAGASIRAGQVPEPGTLGLLAGGAAGLALWRRRRKPARPAAVNVP